MCGKDNVVADAFSRLNDISIEWGLDNEALAIAQSGDPDLQRILKDPSTSLKLQLVSLPNCKKQIYCDVHTQPRTP